MAERNALPSRKPLRLRSHDYSLPGDYFLTLCISQKKCVLGHVEGGVVRLNRLGQTVRSIWEQIPQDYKNVKLDEYIVMPNHVHGIVSIRHEDWNVGDGSHPVPTSRAHVGDGSHPVPMSIPEIVRRFKTLTTKRYRQGVDEGMWTDSGKQLWQRSYFDRVIRNRDELNQIRIYMSNNPLRWGEGVRVQR